MEEDKKPRVVFLDIDGPMIPTSLYFIDGMCSLDRSVMSTIAIGWLRKLVKISGAKIVCNSAHNYMDTGAHKEHLTTRDLKQDLIRHGLKEEYFHEIWRTRFPNPTVLKMSDWRNRRLIAIEEWMRDHVEVDWVGYDDEEYIGNDHSYYVDGNPRLQLINFDKGIDVDAFLGACKIWGIDPATVILS